MEKPIIKEIKIVEISKKHLFRINEKGEFDLKGDGCGEHYNTTCVKCLRQLCQFCNEKRYFGDCEHEHYVAENGKIYMEINGKCKD